MDIRKLSVAILVTALLGVASTAFFAVRARATRQDALQANAELQALTESGAAQAEQIAALKGEQAHCAGALAKVEADLEAAKRANIELADKLTGYSEELVRKQSELRQVNDTRERLTTELQREIANQNVTITRLGTALSVNMVGHVLFASGQASLTPEGIEVLRRVGEVIGEPGDKRIRVVGHTDDRPISAARRGGYASNWDLSAARATSVVRFLVENVGIAPERCEAVGVGEFHPAASNETPEGRMKNRRIEILLVPPLPNAELEAQADIRVPAEPRQLN